MIRKRRQKLAGGLKNSPMAQFGLELTAPAP